MKEEQDMHLPVMNNTLQIGQQTVKLEAPIRHQLPCNEGILVITDFQGISNGLLLDWNGHLKWRLQPAAGGSCHFTNFVQIKHNNSVVGFSPGDHFLVSDINGVFHNFCVTTGAVEAPYSSPSIDGKRLKLPRAIVSLDSEIENFLTVDSGVIALTRASNIFFVNWNGDFIWKFNPPPLGEDYTSIWFYKGVPAAIVYNAVIFRIDLHKGEIKEKIGYHY